MYYYPAKFLSFTLPTTRASPQNPPLSAAFSRIELPIPSLSGKTNAHERRSLYYSLKSVGYETLTNLTICNHLHCSPQK